MYVCDLCGDDWPDSQEKCPYHDAGRRTAYFSTSAELPGWTAMSCSICHSLVSSGDTREHSDWHLRQEVAR